MGGEWETNLPFRVITPIEAREKKEFVLIATHANQRLIPAGAFFELYDVHSAHTKLSLFLSLSFSFSLSLSCCCYFSHHSTFW